MLTYVVALGRGEYDGYCKPVLAKVVPLAGQ